MQSEAFTAPWAQTGWYEQVRAWIDAQLEHLGLDISGAIEQPHVRPWSTVLSIPTTHGRVYFKASAPISAHEAALTAALVRWRPDVILNVLAFDAQRGWMLLPDGGTRFREILKADRNLGCWESTLSTYAALQIELSEHMSELLELGAPDRRLALLPSLYQGLLSSLVTQCIDQADGLTSAQYQRLHKLAPHFASMCKQLSGYHIPASLNHGDLHDGNIFVIDGRTIFFDWGDCSITHPFFSMRTVFVSVENTLGLDEGAPEFDRLRDMYLEPWTRYETRENLRTAFQLALRIAPIAGALVWDGILSYVGSPANDPYIAAIPSLLKEFLGNVSEVDA